MFIPGYYYPDEADVSINVDYPKYDFLIDDTTGINDAKAPFDIDWDDLEINYPQENGFFKGLVIAMSISLFIWGSIIFAIKLIVY